MMQMINDGPTQEQFLDLAKRNIKIRRSISLCPMGRRNFSKTSEIVSPHDCEAVKISYCNSLQCFVDDAHHVQSTYSPFASVPNLMLHIPYRPVRTDNFPTFFLHHSFHVIAHVNDWRKLLARHVSKTFMKIIVVSSMSI